MNPLLAVVVNFQCLNNLEVLIEHALYYWAGPALVELFLTMAKKKVKTDWSTHLLLLNKEDTCK